jgi:hypothetical protein
VGASDHRLENPQVQSGTVQSQRKKKKFVSTNSLQWFNNEQLFLRQVDSANGEALAGDGDLLLVDYFSVAADRRPKLEVYPFQNILRPAAISCRSIEHPEMKVKPVCIRPRAGASRR